VGNASSTIVGVQVYRNDVVVVRQGQAPDTQDAQRGDIWQFSRKSRQRLAFIAANTLVRFLTMITLTYPLVFPLDGKRVKANLRKFLTMLVKDWPTLQYLWFLEFQARGAPHVHILVTRPIPRTRKGTQEWRYRIACEWYRIAATGDRKHLLAGTRVERLRKVDGAARYACKYAAKMYQKTVHPDYRNVGRFWGYNRGVKPEEPALVECSEDDIRGVLEGWKYAPGEEREVYRVLYGVAVRFGRPESHTS